MTSFYVSQIVVIGLKTRFDEKMLRNRIWWILMKLTAFGQFFREIEGACSGTPSHSNLWTHNPRTGVYYGLSIVQKFGNGNCPSGTSNVMIKTDQDWQDYKWLRGKNFRPFKLTRYY